MSNELSFKNSHNGFINLIYLWFNHMVLFFMKKISSYFNYQYTLLCLSMIVLFQTSIVLAFDKIEKIPLSALGGFETNFTTIKKVNFIEGQKLIGEVNSRTGENYSVSFPFDVQRIRYHVKNGSQINKGDTVATVEGYDVHHFIDEYISAQQLLEASENHFQTNKLYFESKTIKSSQWVEITKQYFESKLNFEHIQHQMSFLNIDKNEEITLISPEAGIIKITDLSNNRHEGELAFDVIDPEAIQVKVLLPILNTSSLSHLEVSPQCQLNIESLENIADKYHQTLWASPSKTSACDLTLGQVITLIPIQDFKGYKVKKSAVFEFEENNYIAIESGNELDIISINLFGSKEGEYFFTTNSDIENRRGLTTSVSILQGYLLNLGDE